MAWYINESGELYEYNGDRQAEIYPNDDHTPYLSARGAQEGAFLQECQQAQNAAYADSNDDEIELLRGALETACNLLGLVMPEGIDPYDTPEGE